MSLTSRIEALSDAELGGYVVGYTIRAIKYAAMLAAWWYCGWFVALLLTILAQLLAAAATVATVMLVSEDSFASIGNKTGRAIGSVMNLFSRKS